MCMPVPPVHRIFRIRMPARLYRLAFYFQMSDLREQRSMQYSSDSCALQSRRGSRLEWSYDGDHTIWSPWWIVSRNAGHGFPDRRTITMPVE